jgi:hypothetical protein
VVGEGGVEGGAFARALVAEEVGSCVQWYREKHDEQMKIRAQDQLVNFLRTESWAEPEVPETPPEDKSAQVADGAEAHLPRESSSKDAEPNEANRGWHGAVITICP